MADMFYSKSLKYVNENVSHPEIVPKAGLTDNNPAQG